MGAGTSRRLSVSNPDPPNIVKVTDEVAKRLTSSRPPSPAQTKPPEPAEVPPPRKPREESLTRDIDEGYVSSSSTESGRFVLGVGGQGYPVLETLSAHQVRQLKNDELAKNDTFWRNKLTELEARYVTGAYVAEGEFKKELEKLEKLMPPRVKTPCKDKSVQVSECYSKNSKRPLECSDLVKEFANCVENKSKII